MAWILVLEGRNQGATYNLGQRTCTVGRSPGNYVQLLDHDVSRRHFQLVWDGDRHRVVDLSSANGVFVNGERVLDTWLKDGDLVAMGKTVLRYIASADLPGATDFAQGYKTPSRDVAAVPTTAVDVAEVLSMVSMLQSGLAQAPGHGRPSTATPKAPASADALVDHLTHLAKSSDDRDHVMNVAAAGIGRMLGACRACVMLRQADPAGGKHRLSPVSLWVRPDLSAAAREVLVHREVVRQVASGRPTHAALGNAGEGPTAALAAAVTADGLWYGLLYVDALVSPPPAWRQGHLDLMVRVATLLGRCLQG